MRTYKVKGAVDFVELRAEDGGEEIGHVERWFERDEAVDAGCVCMIELEVV